MTIRALVEVPIGRSPQSVWDELTAVERFPEWLAESGIVGVEREDGPLGAGSQLRIRQRLGGGKESVLDGSVTEWEPGRRFAFRARHPDGITLDALAELGPQPPVTWLRWSLEINLPLRMRLFESMAAPEVRRAATADLTSFKRRLEQVAG